jgi:23S rRNA (uracil1939-C5)-methyltransferase
MSTVHALAYQLIAQTREEALLTSLFCKLANRCSGCDRLHLNRSTLEENRREQLRILGLSSVPTDFVWIEAGKLRDRLEFTLEPGTASAPVRFGLLDKNREELVDIDECGQLSEALQVWLSDFRKDLPHVPARRSVRLRVAPNGARGAWLDFANEDIRNLLEEEQWLERQLKNGIIIEAGQKRKRIVANPSGPRKHRMTDPTLEAWFETPIGTSAAQLFATIGTFTQPGFKSTHALVKTVLAHMLELNGDANTNLSIAEFGAGIGCFTLPLLATGARVDVFESDRLALSALEKGVSAAGLDSTRLKIHTGDFILASRAAEALRTSIDPVPYDLVVVDPPRPGLGTFIESISQRATNANWVYVSCYPESFAKDVLALSEKGLKIERLTVVEQFPFTRHFEIVASFTRASTLELKKKARNTSVAASSGRYFQMSKRKAVI